MKLKLRLATLPRLDHVRVVCQFNPQLPLQQQRRLLYHWRLGMLTLTLTDSPPRRAGAVEDSHPGESSAQASTLKLAPTLNLTSTRIPTVTHVKLYSRTNNTTAILFFRPSVCSSISVRTRQGQRGRCRIGFFWRAVSLEVGWCLALTVVSLFEAGHPLRCCCCCCCGF